MRIGLLGPLQVADDAGAAVRPPGPRLRTLLAALALNAGSPVPGDRLAELVWNGTPPSAYSTTLRSHVLRLRRALPSARIETSDAGYALSAVGLRLDVIEFEALGRQAAEAAHAEAWTEASTTAAAALSLWRGEPLLDVPSQALGEMCVPQLERLRVQVMEDWIEAQLRLGLHESVLEQLRGLTARYPLHERFHAQLLRALASSGRRAEALTAYLEARRTLVDELGVEPGPELRRLHEQILLGDDDPPAEAGLSVPDDVPSLEAAPEPLDISSPPRRLPAAARHFTGRQRELDQLVALVRSRRQADGPGGTVVISAIDGMAGIGKTALAVHLAHRLAEQFPGGQLFVDLHGHTRGHPPREPGQALEVLLRALGVSAAQIPEEPEESAALYRQRLAGTRTLILLDNARDEAQVRPLLPGHPGSLVLVTSRKRLKGLDDAHSISLDLLPHADAAVLLRAVAGPGRVAADDPLLAEIAALCGHLPLALRIAGALLRHRPAWSPEHLAGLLRDQRHRLAALSDGERNLSAVFDLSYTAQDERHRLLFRLLGLVPGPDADTHAAAALLGCDPRTAAAMLEDLVDHNLLIAHAPGRYRMHDLLRAHAAGLAAADPPADRDAAVDRLLHYYAHTAQSASSAIARCPRPDPEGPAPAHAPRLSDPEHARAWLRAERENLEAAHAHARAAGLDDHAVTLATGLAEILRSDGPLGQACDMLQDAADTAQRRGRHAACATALTDLAIARRLSGDLPGSGETLTRALEICRRIGYRSGEASALAELGMVKLLTGDAAGAGAEDARAVTIFQEIGHRPGEAAALIRWAVAQRLAGDLPQSTDTLTRALEICRRIGYRGGEASALAELGAVRRLAGDLSGAGEAHLQALRICREIGHRDGEATALTGLGAVRRLDGDLSGADDALTRAVEIYRRFGHRAGEAHALAELGRVRHLAGDTPAAARALRRALETFRTTGNRNNEAWALNHYAAVIAAAGHLPHAVELYQRALSLNRELDKPDDEAISLEGLGECRLALGDAVSGAAGLNQAAEIFERLGMARDAARVRGRITALTTAERALSGRIEARRPTAGSPCRPG
jgi:DNA-binding SARP family transcriptional activator/tetratricopeptide (TPR) repeat protein